MKAVKVLRGAAGAGRDQPPPWPMLQATAREPRPGTGRPPGDSPETRLHSEAPATTPEEATHPPADLEDRLEALERRHAEERAALEAQLQRESARVEGLVETFGRTVENLIAEKVRLLEHVEDAAVRVALAVARRIVGAAVQLDERVVLETVRKALERIQESETVVVRVAPEVVDVVAAQQPQWLEVAREARSLRIEPDPRVDPGGCIVSTSMGDIDARIAAQLDALEAALLAAPHAETGVPDPPAPGPAGAASPEDTAPATADTKADPSAGGGEPC